MPFRFLPVAAAVPFLLLLSARPSASAPLPVLPHRAALGRCDPSSTRVDCGYYGTEHFYHPETLPLYPIAFAFTYVAIRHQRNAMRTAQLLLVTHRYRRNSRYSLVLHAEPAVARLRYHPSLQRPRFMHQRCLRLRFGLRYLCRT
jgi:hypothetical protein